MTNKLLIEFSAQVAEIINGAESKRSTDGYFQWAAWKIESNIINLLSGNSYCGLPGKKRYADNLVGRHMAAHQDIAYSAEQYFQMVFEYEISNRRNLESPPTDKLQNTIREHCLDAQKQQEENLCPVSLWRILQRAGEQDSGKPNQLYYRYWLGEDNRRFKLRLYNVLSSANRHYSELYRLGFYPPDYVDALNVSQARKLNQLIVLAKQYAREAGNPERWRKYMATAWQQEPLKKIGEDKLTTYEDFMAHPIGKRILGHTWANTQYIPYDESDDTETHQNDPFSLAEINEFQDIENDVEESFYSDLADLERKLNQAILPRRDKELLFRIIHTRDISDMIADDEDEDELFAHLKSVLFKIWHNQ